MKKHINILIPDGESTFTLLVIHCFSFYKNLKIHVLSSKKRNPVKASKYVKYYKLYSEKSDDNWFSIVNNEVEKLNIDIIVPIAETENRFWIVNKSKLNKAKIIALPKLEAFDIAINKKKLNTFLFEKEICAPNSVFIKDIFELSKTESIGFPVLIKPLDEAGGDGIVRFETYDQLQNYFNVNNIGKGVFVQKYIKGYDIDCSVLCSNGDVLTYTIQKGNMQASTPYKQQFGVVFLENEKVLKVVKDIMKALDWSGIAHVDLRYDEVDNDYKPLEINARFWGSIDASRSVGINFPYMAIQNTLGKNLEFIDYEYKSYLSYKGLLKRPSLLFNPKFLSLQTDVKNNLLDPFPFVYKTMYWFARKLGV
jgi:glutathione synthase/RimK-type ligase-like ATP-grasp enzyme